jgi:hypothetical protein
MGTLWFVSPFFVEVVQRHGGHGSSLVLNYDTVILGSRICRIFCGDYAVGRSPWIGLASLGRKQEVTY